MVRMGYYTFPTPDIELIFSYQCVLKYPVLAARWDNLGDCSPLKGEIRKQEALTFSWIYLVLLVITTIWIAILSMSSPTIFDDGLYHFNSIRWLNEYPIVLGLGNLHSRLAFNQSFFAYVAYLNIYPVFNHGYNLANSFLWLVLLAECLWHISGFGFP